MACQLAVYGLDASNSKHMVDPTLHLPLPRLLLPPPPPAAAAQYAHLFYPARQSQPRCPRPRPRSVRPPHAPAHANLGKLRSAPAHYGSTTSKNGVELPSLSLNTHRLISAPPHEAEQVHEDVMRQMQAWIGEIKGMFQSIDLGEITVSPYDTAWVAMVPSSNDSMCPQFPQCLKWIVQNQLSDGSWGDTDIFLAYERVCNTVACVVALQTWSYGEENITKGIEYIHNNIHKMEKEADDYMPTAFEVIFPALLEDAQLLGINLPYDSPVVERLRRERTKKLDRIPMDVLHTYPTTLLHSLEGLHRLVDWNKIMKLQASNGSFLFSPASTACALIYARDPRCLEYLESTLNKFKDAVPSVFPVDIFERLWMVDRLERLGISRFFNKEIKDVLDYVYRYWTPNGLAWAKESNVFDVDDTAMGFRLLRLHGYHVSPDVFCRFKSNEEFYCFEGQTSQAVTGMHNLHRASQIAFPNEGILEDINNFTLPFLVDKQKEDKIQDKWVISKGLKGEVGYSINNPWCQSLQRIETREYIRNYCVDDAWIAKSLYKMPYINNPVFLNLAKLDYNLCQFFHQKELAQVLMWNKECKFDELKFVRQKPIECFFSIAATCFEPEYSYARIVWAKCGVLVTVVDDFFDTEGSLFQLQRFLDAIQSWDRKKAQNFTPNMKILFNGLYNTINTISQEALRFQGHDFSLHLRKIVVKFVKAMYKEAEWRFLNYSPTLEEYMENAKDSISLESIIQPAILFLGDKFLEEDFMNDDYLCIMDTLSKIARLNNDMRGYKRENSQDKSSCISIFMNDNPSITDIEAVRHFTLIRDEYMKVLVRECLRHSKISEKCKMVHLNMAKILNFFYSKGDGHTSLDALYEHVKNTLYLPIS